MRILPSGMDTLPNAIDRVGRVFFSEDWTGLEIMTPDSHLPHLARVAFAKFNAGEFGRLSGQAGVVELSPCIDDEASNKRWENARDYLHRRLADGDEAAAAYEGGGTTRIIRATEWFSDAAAVGLKSGIWQPDADESPVGEILIVRFDGASLAPQAKQPPPRVPYVSKIATGRRIKFDWEGALIELACLYRIEGTQNKSQPEIVAHLQDWFIAAANSEPKSSETLRLVKRFQKAITAADEADGNS